MAKTGNTVDIVPLGDRVLIQILDESEQEKKSAAGIIIPASAKEDKPDRGTVIAVGAGRVNDNGEVKPLAVKTGDKVIFQWGEKITLDDTEYQIVNESNILAVIKK